MKEKKFVKIKNGQIGYVVDETEKEYLIITTEDLIYDYDIDKDQLYIKDVCPRKINKKKAIEINENEKDFLEELYSVKLKELVSNHSNKIFNKIKKLSKKKNSPI